MDLLDYRLKMKWTMGPDEDGKVEAVSEDEQCDGDLGTLNTFAIEIDDVPNVSLQIAVLRRVLQKRKKGSHDERRNQGGDNERQNQIGVVRAYGYKDRDDQGQHVKQIRNSLRKRIESNERR